MRNKLPYVHICSYSVNETSVQQIYLLTYSILQAVRQIVKRAHRKKHAVGRSEIQSPEVSR